MVAGNGMSSALKDISYALQMASPCEVRGSDNNIRNAQIVWIRNTTLEAFQTVKPKDLVSQSFK